MLELSIESQIFPEVAGNIAGSTVAMVAGLPGRRTPLRIGHAHHLADGTSECTIDTPKGKLDVNDTLWLADALRQFAEAVKEQDAKRALTLS